MSWDITSTVQSWVAGTQSNFGLLLKHANEPTTLSGPKPPSRNYAPEPTLGPKLEVTYAGDGGQLLEPETVHSNGAELRWIPYAGPGAPPFTSYEVHRSASQGFTPSATTRLTTIKDAAVTSYRDTTGKAGATFTYKILSSGVETNRQTLTLPADGLASKMLRPDPSAGFDTYIAQRLDLTDCVNRGALDRVKVGTDAVSIWRPLLRFDLRDIAPEMAISAATLSLWHPDTTTTALTVRAHRLTANWEEGSGVDTCAADGATWYETTGGVRWTQDGGDFDPAAAATLAIPSGSQAGWSQWSMTSLAQQWAAGTYPNDGLLFKLDDETRVAGKSVDFYSSDFAVAPTLRPKLSVSYSDGSHAVAPSVSIAKPTAGTLVKGSAVQIDASAWDDRRVDSVQFFVDGNSIGTDTSEPFSVNWNSTSVGNGSHSLTARATDDAGNQTTSAAVSVSVGNATPPTTSITSPTGGTVTGTVTVIASASAGVTKVEFYADGTLFATDTSSPYSVSWNTLDPALPAYDGSHTLTTKAYDAYTQVTTSAPVTVTVSNRILGTKYWADFSSTAFPPRMESQQQYSFDVTVTNRSTVTWAAGEVLLRYRWYTLDSATSLSDSAGTAVGTLAPNGSTTVTVLVQPPTLPVGLARQSYRLRFDLFDGSPNNSWFAAHGNKPLQDTVRVGVMTREQTLGLEPYYQYVSEELGLGMQSLANVATGDSIVRWRGFQAPGQGLSTAVQLTYNSREGNCDAHQCPVGEGWSLAISSLTRFDIDGFRIHPPGNPSTVTLTDADGTTQEFRWQQDDQQRWYWKPPDGVNLYLRHITPSVACARDPQGPTAEWAVTTPDRLTYFYDELGGGKGFPLKVRDRNDNELCFEATGDSGNRRVTKVYDQAGRFFDLIYASNQELNEIRDHLGHRLLFCRQNPRTLVEIRELGGTDTRCSDPPSAGSRSFNFTYVDDSDPDTCDENGPLASVRDPRGNLTTFDYDSNRRLCLYTDRTRTATTSFSYPASETTISAPLARVTRYHYLIASPNANSVDLITRVNPNPPYDEQTQINWTAAPQPLRHVQKITGPGGGTTEYTYDQNGPITEEKVLTDAGPPAKYSRTLSEYDNLPVDGNDVHNSISQLRKRTNPNGADTPDDDYAWQYFYDAVGNLTRVVDPCPPNELCPETTYEYYQGPPSGPKGALHTVKDANTHFTDYESYDANGFPQLVRQRKATGDLITRYCYDADGLLLWLQDPLHTETGTACPATDGREFRTVSEYDSFHRLRRQSSPKSTRFDRGKLIWSETGYDANDNVISEIQPYYASDERRTTTKVYDAMDRQTSVTEPEPSEITTFQYDAAGRLTRTTLPRGVGTADPNDYVTENSYDPLDRVVTETRYPPAPSGLPERKTHSCYDLAGDLRWLTAPNANEPAPPNCNAVPPPATTHTTKYTYDLAHRQLTETTQAAAGDLLRTRRQYYDPNGNVVREDDEQQTATTYVFSERDELTKTEETFTKDPITNDPVRKLTTVLNYDNVGNLVREVSPRAWDACNAPPPATGCDPGANGDYVAEYRYDEVDQLTRIAQPDDAANTRKYIHRAYDANGNLTMTSLPVEDAEPPVPLDKQTALDYWDAGSIYSSWDHIDPEVRFDYSAEGWQTARKTPRVRGSLMTWEYYPDGLLNVARDRKGHPATYLYDEDDNLKQASEARGQGSQPLKYLIESDYNGFDEPTETRQREAQIQTWTLTKYLNYDRNGNLLKREDSGTRPIAGGAGDAGRLQKFSYNWVDEVTEQLDLGVDPDELPDAGDRQLTLAYLRTGWQSTETLSRHDGSNWSPKRATTWEYFVNGDAQRITTIDPLNQQTPVLEKHALEYEEVVDGRNVYVNGNRTSDSFVLRGPNGSPTHCETEGVCKTFYKYGPRENLNEEKRIRFTGTEWTCDLYDPAMNVTDEWVQSLACPGTGSPTRHFDYPLGNRLTHMTVTSDPTKNRRYFHDEDGNLDCMTKDGWTLNKCPPAPTDGASIDADLVEDFSWHYQNRLQSYRKYSAGAETDSATYRHDPLDRLYEQSESHGGPMRTIRFDYLGLSDLVSQETSDGQAKSYTYDLSGRLLALDIGAAGSPPSEEYAYGANVHTDVSQLLNLTSSPQDRVRASYGYKPYGGQEDALTQGDPVDTNVINPHRFNAKRYDSGSTMLDMGARRFRSDEGRFAQQDTFLSAVDDLGLSLDPDMNNRYAFAQGNPVSQIELDGHSTVDPSDVQKWQQLLRFKYWFFEARLDAYASLGQGPIRVGLNNSLPYLAIRTPKFRIEDRYIIHWIHLAGPTSLRAHFLHPYPWGHWVDRVPPGTEGRQIGNRPPLGMVTVSDRRGRRIVRNMRYTLRLDAYFFHLRYTAYASPIRTQSGFVNYGFRVDTIRWTTDADKARSSQHPSVPSWAVNLIRPLTQCPVDAAEAPQLCRSRPNPRRG